MSSLHWSLVFQLTFYKFIVLGFLGLNPFIFWTKEPKPPLTNGYRRLPIVKCIWIGFHLQTIQYEKIFFNYILAVVLSLMKHPHVHLFLTCIQMTIPLLNLLSLLLSKCCHMAHLGKLHFTILNYTINYTLYPKLFEYTFCIINYDSCYTLHPDVKFSINFDVNPKFRMQSVIKSIV